MLSVILKGVQKAEFQSSGFCCYHLLSLILMHLFEKHLNTQEYIRMPVFAEML